MRTLVLYTSKTGNTQKYAEDLASAVKADVLPFKKFKKKMIDSYDCIVYGGYVMGEKIQGIDEFLRHYELMKEKEVIIFSCGMSFVTKETRAHMIDANILDLYHVRYYQLRGSFDFNKLGPVQKFLMNHSLRMIANSEDASADQRALLTLKETPLTYYDQAGIDRMVSVINKIAAEKDIIVQ